MGKEVKVDNKKLSKAAKKVSSDESSDEDHPVVTIPSKSAHSTQKGKAPVKGKKQISESESSSSDSKPKKGKAAPAKKGADTKKSKVVDSSSSEEEVKPLKGGKKAKVSSSESEEEVKPSKKPTPVKAVVEIKKPTPAKGKALSSESDSSEEEVKKPSKAKKPAKKVSSSESESEQEVKKPASAKKPVKKVSSSESESEQEVKKPAQAKKVSKKVSSSESESEVEVKKPASGKKAKKVSSSESEEEVKPSASKKSAKKHESSDSSDEDVLPKKRKSSTSEPTPLKKPAVHEQTSDLKRNVESSQFAPPTKQFKGNESGDLEIFVGGLSYNATEDDLNNLFAPCGEIEALRLLYDQNGSSKGIAFVKFFGSEGVSKALQLNGSQHLGRTLRINMSSDKPTGDRPQPRGNSDNSTTIFVGSLSYNSTEDSIRSFFGTCGDIKAVRVAMDPEGNPKGFAHVEFFAADGVEKAVQLNGSDLDGRNIKVDHAGGKSGGSAGGPGGFRGGAGGGQPRFGAPKDNAKQKGSIQAFQGKKMTF